MLIKNSKQFIIYINDFSETSQVFNFISYADDPTLLSSLSNFVNAQNADSDLLIDKELFKINEWLVINKLSLNIAISKFMVFYMHRKQELPLRIKIVLYNTLLVPNINYCLTM